MIPLATTTVTVAKPPTGVDRYEPSGSATTVASAVPAHISSPSGSDAVVGGEQSTVDAVLLAEPIVGIDHYCTVTDDATDDAYEVVWVRQRRGLGLDHTKAGLRVVQGASR